MLTNFIKRLFSKYKFETINDSPLVRVVFLPIKTKSFFGDVVIRPGSLGDSKDKPQISHLLEHYIFALINEKFGNKIEYNASVSNDIIRFIFDSNTLTAQADFLLFVKMILNPDFNREDIFNNEKEAIKNELLNKNNDLEHFVFETTVKLFHKEGDIYGLDDFDNFNHFPFLTLKDIKEYYEKIFVDKNITILAGANSFTSNFKKEIQKILANSKIKIGEEFIYPKPEFSNKPLVKIVTDERFEQNNICLIFSGVNSQVKNEIEYLISGCVKSFLNGKTHYGVFGDIRKHGIYDCRANYISLWESGVFYIFSNPQPGNTENVIRIISDKLLKLKNEIISDEIFNVEKDKQIVSTVENYKDNANYYSRIKNYSLGFISEKMLNNEAEAIKKISTKQIQEWSQKTFDKDKCLLLVIGKKQNISCLSEEELLRTLKF